MIYGFPLEYGESVVWKHTITKGIFRKTKVESWIITNQRIIIFNEIGGYVMEELPLSAITDVQVVNQSHQSNSSFMGSSTGSYRTSRFAYGQSRSTSVTKGFNRTAVAVVVVKVYHISYPI